MRLNIIYKKEIHYCINKKEGEITTMMPWCCISSNQPFTSRPQPCLSILGIFQQHMGGFFHFPSQPGGANLVFIGKSGKMELRITWRRLMDHPNRLGVQLPLMLIYWDNPPLELSFRRILILLFFLVNKHPHNF